MTTLVIPEARAQAARIGALFTDLGAWLGEQRTIQLSDHTIQTIEKLAEIIRAADELLDTLPAATDVLEEEAQLARIICGMRTAAFLLMKNVNPDQAWFWTEEWQAGEREVDASIAAGEGTFFENDEAFDAYLRGLRPDIADL